MTYANFNDETEKILDPRLRFRGHDQRQQGKTNAPAAEAQTQAKEPNKG